MAADRHGRKLASRRNARRVRRRYRDQWQLIGRYRRTMGRNMRWLGISFKTRRLFRRSVFLQEMV